MQAFPFDSKLTYDEHDNPIYDRAVSSQPLRELIRGLFSTGVMPNPSTCLQVSAGTDGMTVKVAAGFAVVDGGLCKEKDTRTLEVTAADNTYDRIDTVVVRWNENVDVRTADLYVVAGTPAVNPVRPTLQRNNSIYEIGLADVFITKRVATITNDKITDTRYEAERCGIVSSISEFDTTTLYQQIQADLTGFKATEQANFLTWYENIRNILDENAAGHLQNEIDALQPVRKRTITNLLDPSLYIITSQITQNGVTITNNGDGTFTVNGTTNSNVGSDGRIAVNIIQWAANTKIATGYSKLKLCGTPSSINKTGMLQIADLNTNSSNATTWASDKGDGFVFNTVDDEITLFALRFEFLPNTTFDNAVFKPMLTADLQATYDDYVEYSGDGELNENVADISKKLADVSKQLTANSQKFKFAYSTSKDKYGYEINGVFRPFSNGAVLIGTYSSDTTINVSAYGATSSSQFLAVCDTDTNTSAEWGNGQEGNFGMGWLHAQAKYIAPTKSLSGSTLSLTVGKMTYSSQAPSGSGTATKKLPTSVYYVGDIESA